MSSLIPLTFKRETLPALAGLALLCLSACMVAEDNGPVAKTEKALVFALTSDYKSAASYSIFGIDSAFINKDLQAIHTDAVVRYLGGDDIYILNRMGRDNLQGVSRHKLDTTVFSIQFPALSNPYDVAVKDSLLYVAFYGSYPKIGIYKQADGESAGTIDLSAFADSADHFPETTELLIIGDTLYALLANMNNSTYLPMQARLAKIDLTTKSIQALDLPYGNPISMAYDSAAGKLYIPCRGTFLNFSDYSLVLDGGIVGVKLSEFAVVETVATEADLHGSVNKVFLDGGRLLMDLTTASDDKVVAIALADGKAKELASLKPYDLSAMALDAATRTLFVGDRTNGLRFFDLATDAEKAGSKVNLGAAPILDLAVIR